MFEVLFGMTLLDLIIYLVSVVLVAGAVALPASCLLCYAFHLLDCLNDPERNDWHVFYWNELGKQKKEYTVLEELQALYEGK